MGDVWHVILSSDNNNLLNAKLAKSLMAYTVKNI